MKRISKIVSLGLAIALSASIFTGCGAKKVEPQKEIITKVEDVDTKVYKISWVPQNDGPVDPNSPVVQELEKKLNVKFDFIYMDRNKEVELMNMRVATGEIPDVYRLNSDDRFRTFVSQGIYSEIPLDLLKKKAPKMYEATNKNAGGESVWEYAKEGGKLYAIPLVNFNGAYHYSPIWRDDWLKNVGITKLPETLKEAEDAFYKFVNNDPDKNGKKDTFALSDKGMSVVFGAYGGLPYQSKGGNGTFTWSIKDGKPILTAVMPEMKEALTLLNKWYKDGLIDPEFLNEENKGQSWSYSLPFWNGKIGFTCPGLYYHFNGPLDKANEKDIGSVFYQNFKKLQTGGTYVAGKPFSGPKGKAGTEAWGTLPTSYIVLGKQVGQDQGKLNRILEINEKLFSDKDFAITAWLGRKDIDYSLTSSGYTVIGDALDVVKKGNLGIGTGGIAYALANNFEFGSSIMVPVKYEYATKVGKMGNGYANPVWGGLPSYGQYKSTIDKKVREAYMLFILGDKKIEDFDKFVDDLNKSGLDVLTKEANEWYTKFNKK